MRGGGRLVPQGLRAARRARGAASGRCASSRSTTARGCGSTAARSARNRGAYIPFEIRLNGPQATGHEPARRPRRLAPAADRLPALGPEPRTATPTGGWWNYGGIQREVYLRAPRHGRVRQPCACCRSCRAARCPATVRGARRAAQRDAARGRRVRVDRRLRLAPRRARHARGIPRQRRQLVHRPRSRMPQPARCGRRRRPNLYSVKIDGARGRAHASARYRLTRHPLDQGLARPPAPQRPPVNMRGVGVHEDTSARRASRSTTRSASGWSARPRRSAPR